MGIFTNTVIVGTVATIMYAAFLQQDPEAPELVDGYWGKGAPKEDSDVSIRPFVISSSKEMLTDLKNRLKKARLGEDLENTEFQYGFQVRTMRPIIKYWLESFDWEKQVAELNKFPHFKTTVEGIDIHFLHVKPSKEQLKSARPILITHGWPGSIVEFYKLIPLLTGGSIPFEVICPSLPGYGFSEAPHQPGFDATDTARVWMKLMNRLGHDKFYIQGGDWGALVSSILSQAYTEKILGVHLNMFNPPLRSGEVLVKQILASIVPSLVFHPDDIPHYKSLFSNFGLLLRETGYMHIQATKPDTVAFSLNDSPVGLAAYILEKFSGWTNKENLNLENGGLTEKFTLDELLTNVMIYWVNGNIGSSMRFYKEFFASDAVFAFDRVPVHVPAGLALFPQEIVTVPEALAKIKFRNIKQFTRMPRGGHFAALEEPRLLAKDIINFVQKVENDV